MQKAFFRIREAILCPTGRSEQHTEFAWTNFETWDDERIKRYPHFLKSCGFNSIQLAEIRAYCGARKTQDMPRVSHVFHLLADEAHRLDMRVSQFIWGQCLFHEAPGDTLCWNDERERKWMHSEFARLADTYAGCVDHIVVHVADPGGCDRNGCDAYRTPQLIANALQEQYLRRNQSVTATLSTWANQAFWDGAAEAEYLLDETFSPRSLGIALHRFYDSKQAELVTNSGRNLGIWCWYMADYEMATDCTFQMQLLDRYFTSLPAKASEHVDWISVERCFHGMPSDINLWVAGRKMTEPYRPLNEIIREFCEAVFGGGNAETAQSAFELSEAGQFDQRIYGYFIPEADRYPKLLDGELFRNQAKDMIARLEKVSINDGAAEIPHVTSPQWMLEFLKRRLQLLHDYSLATTGNARSLPPQPRDPLYHKLADELSRRA